MSDDRINSVSIVVTTKDAGVIGEEHHGDVDTVDDLRRALKSIGNMIELELVDRKLIRSTPDVDKLNAIRRMADSAHGFDTRGRLFVYVDSLDEVLDQ